MTGTTRAPRDHFPDRAGTAARHAELIRGKGVFQLPVVIVLSALIGLTVLALMRLEFSFTNLASGIKLLGTYLGLMVPPNPGGKTWVFLHALAETVAISFLGTLLAGLLALPLGFMAARGILNGWLLRAITRRFSDTLRGVDTLIWALIWINVVGLGPFAGVLAIMTSDIGSFTKLFSEAIETADPKPSEGVASSGGTRMHEIRFGLLPQVLPVILSQLLYYFESNTRSATIIGIVGAGGIGLHLAEMIRTFEWDRVSFIILLVLVTVAVIDLLSTRLRLAMIGRKSSHN